MTSSHIGRRRRPRGRRVAWRHEARLGGTKPIRVLFVCMGNICRSPTAAGVFAEMVRKSGLSAQIEVASAGTISYHAGEPPDDRAQAHAKRRGYDLSAIRAQQVTRAMLDAADVVLAMDRDNLAELRRL